MTRRLNELYKGKNQFGIEVAQKLYIKGKNQKWLAEQCGVTKGYISQIINGTCRPSPEITEKIAVIFEIDAEKLRAMVLIAS